MNFCGLNLFRVEQSSARVFQAIAAPTTSMENRGRAQGSRSQEHTGDTTEGDEEDNEEHGRMRKSGGSSCEKYTLFVDGIP